MEGLKLATIYTGAMGMIGYMGKLDVISNNIANAKTDGYKADRETFRVLEETMMNVNYKGEKTKIGSYKDEMYIDQIETNFMPGMVQVSPNKLDVSLEDKDFENQTSFFIVNYNGENYLTRSGKFKMDGDGYLSTMNGAFALNNNGQRIKLDTNTPFEINSSGEIVNAESEQVIDRIQIKTVNSGDTGFLEKKFGTMFKVLNYDDLVKSYGSVQNILNEYDNDSTLQSIFKNKNKLQEVANTQNVDILNDFTGLVHSRMTESSNVDLTVELTRMMEAQKGVQMSQKVINTLDKILEKDANQVSK
jgi:flagellar basal-body rod protein FlgF